MTGAQTPKVGTTRAGAIRVKVIYSDSQNKNQMVVFTCLKQLRYSCFLTQQFWSGQADAFRRTARAWKSSTLNFENDQIRDRGFEDRMLPETLTQIVACLREAWATGASETLTGNQTRRSSG